jgi:hypothetical protein
VKKIFALMLTFAFVASLAVSTTGCPGKTEAKKDDKAATEKKEEKK